ncbi:MAG: cell division protein ZapA [Alphaproteobacteria bacterium]|nr:cell division protein ZapA [Alphaproteobacteria bacterium]MBO6629292.1 cell division protein ZapA [Alphaproteobacteria bacterium]MDF1626717.1 cell division protein ZapA [Parvibaculaceae bacterium]
MGQVNVSINDRSYSVACGDGEEAHLKELAAYLDGVVTDLSKTVGQVGDTRLLLLAGLMAADELSEAKSRIERLSAEIEALRDARDAEVTRAATIETNVAAVLSQAAVKIDKMAQRIEAS